MATNFQIKTSMVRGQTDDLVRCVNKLNNVISSAESVRNRLEIGQVYSSLQSTINTLYSEKDKMMKMQLSLHSIINQYDHAEKEIINNSKSVNKVKKPGGISSGSVYPETSENAGTGTNSNTATNGKEKEDGPSLINTILKTLFDAGGEFGSIGKTGSVFKNLFQMIIDGDGFTVSDVGAVIKSSGDSVLGVMDLIEHYKASDWKEMLGLQNYKGISIDSQASWAKNMKNTALNSLDDQLNIFKTGTREIDCPKAAGWALSLIANGFSNAEECQSGEITGGRAVAETISETLIDIGKGAALTVGIAAGLAAIGVSAPAVVVAGAGVVISAGADFVCEKITGKPVTELVSDAILDTAAKAGETITGAVSSAGEAISGWFNKVRLAW